MESNARAVLEAVSETLIDKVFTSTIDLSANGILHFIEQMIRSSAIEISGKTMKGMIGVDSGAGNLAKIMPQIVRNVIKGKGEHHVRMYCLQKLVEVADYNMDIRPRIVWTQIWEMMASHFVDICSQDNPRISMFAIDSLRQLSFKFLAKPELNDFNFQRLFLRPFDDIMKHPNSQEEIRELVLRCVDNMIRSLSNNLRSGWKVLFCILAQSSMDSSPNINKLGLAILQRILDEHTEILCCRYGTAIDDINSTNENNTHDNKRQNADAEDFVSLCKASISFIPTCHVKKPLPIGLSMRALCHIACYSDLIASKNVLPPVSSCQVSIVLGK